MSSHHTDAPPPDLRIVPTSSLNPHEEHDTQRALPLIRRLRHEEIVINPPIVAPVEGEQFVILDGANRCYAFSELGYAHILVQVAPYDSGYVDLKTWRHIIGGWNSDEFIQCLRQLPEIKLADGMNADAIAHVLLKGQGQIAILSSLANIHKRNATLCEVVRVYQRKATLYRTAMSETEDVWSLHPDGIAMMIFPDYQPSDIMAAARLKALLPPGISRHIIHGRALRVNYPLSTLRDETASLSEKNEILKTWLQQKLANRKVRYYAEATYQFDE